MSFLFLRICICEDMYLPKLFENIIYLSVLVCLSNTYTTQTVYGSQLMQADIQEIEAMKTRLESRLINTEGVESISIGLGKDGKPCLMIGLSLSEEHVREKLPMELFIIPVEFMFVGKIEAQSGDN